MAKKGKMTLPRVDRSRALPVRTGWGLWKTIAVAAVVGAGVYIVHGPETTQTTPEAPAVVVTQ